MKSEAADQIAELLRSHKITAIHKVARRVVFRSLSPCAWTQGKDDIWRCQVESGETCRGECQRFAVDTEKDGEELTIIYCLCI